MSSIPSTIQFFTTNILDTNFIHWTLTNATVVSGHVAIQPGGSMSYTITDKTKITSSQYTQLVVQAAGAITETNNYKSGTDINIIEDYIVGSSIQRRVRNIVVTPFSATLVGTVYTDTKILEMLNQNMNDYTVTIINNTAAELDIYSIAVYLSQDLSSGQYTQIQTTSITVIQPLSADPTSPVLGQVWLRTDL